MNWLQIATEPWSYGRGSRGAGSKIAGQIYSLRMLIQLQAETVINYHSPPIICIMSFLIAVIFLASFHEPHVIFEQLSLIYSLPR